VGFLCLGDDSPAIGSLNCFAGTGVTTSPFDVRTVPAGGVCVLSVNGACAFYLNGLAVYTNNTPAPLIELVVNSSLTGYLPFPVNAPAQCIGVLAPC
jgi:hypothetical protein